MPSLTDHQSSSFTKLIYIGDSSTGKTGSLASLVCAGYKVRVLDMDNGLESLVQYVRRGCKDKLPNVDYLTFRDEYKMGMNPATGKREPRVSSASAYVDAVKALEKWEDDSDPAEWGKDTILVIDSLTSLGRAAFEWAVGMNPGAKDPRQWYGTAQKSIENIISLLTGDAFHSNVIVISHITVTELMDGSTKGYPSAIGSALGRHLAKYFNTLVLCTTAGIGKNLRRTIQTVPTAMIDLKVPLPEIEDTLPLESGLATLFEKLRERD